MNKIQKLRAMDLLARSVNDEDAIEYWLTYGVPDGEIKETTTDEDLQWLIEYYDEIVAVFLRCMVAAREGGGLLR